MSSSSSHSEKCQAWVDKVPGEYGYKPSLIAGVVFCGIFALSMTVHTIQACWKRAWWANLFSIGALVELIGWGGRTWSAECPYNKDAFLMQISTLIMAPTFITAGIYVILGRFIEFAGVKSLLTPRQYLWIFCTCDVISLVVQAVGGGLASVAVSKPHGNTKPGTNIMVAGIIFQMASITVFVVCAADFLRRMFSQNLMHLLSRQMKWLLVATAVSVVFIYARSIYRTIELLQGWKGYLITHQIYFVILDGGMIAPAVIVFNIFHPGWSFTHGIPEEPYEGGELRNSTMEGPYIEMRDIPPTKATQFHF